MTSAFRSLTDRTLNRLEAGLSRISRGDRSNAQALARDAREVLGDVQPFYQFIHLHARLLCVLGIAMLGGTLAAGFMLLKSLGDPSTALALQSGMTAGVGATLLCLAAATVERVSAVAALAVEVLDKSGY